MSDDLSRLAELAEKQWKAQKGVDAADVALKSAKVALADLAEKQIPELMDSLNMVTFTTTGGLKIHVKEAIRASIPKKHLAEALAWLRKNKHEKLIKRTLSIVPRSDDDAETLADYFRNAGFEFSDDPKVHPQTLGAFVREKLENGEEIPDDLFGVFRQRVAKIQL